MADDASLIHPTIQYCSIRGRHVAGRGIGAFTEEMFFHLRRQILAGALNGWPSFRDVPVGQAPGW
jgi:hypothetical protein